MNFFDRIRFEHLALKKLLELREQEGTDLYFRDYDRGYCNALRHCVGILENIAIEAEEVERKVS